MTTVEILLEAGSSAHGVDCVKNIPAPIVMAVSFGNVKLMKLLI
jgi:hypothetical protein